MQTAQYASWWHQKDIWMWNKLNFTKKKSTKFRSYRMHYHAPPVVSHSNSENGQLDTGSQTASKNCVEFIMHVVLNHFNKKISYGSETDDVSDIFATNTKKNIFKLSPTRNLSYLQSAFNQASLRGCKIVYLDTNRLVTWDHIKWSWVSFPIIQVQCICVSKDVYFKYHQKKKQIAFGNSNGVFYPFKKIEQTIFNILFSPKIGLTGPEF